MLSTEVNPTVGDESAAFQSEVAYFYRPKCVFDANTLTLAITEQTYDVQTHTPGPDVTTVIPWGELGVSANVAMGLSAFSLMGALSGVDLQKLAGSLRNLQENQTASTVESYLVGALGRDQVAGINRSISSSFFTLNMYKVIGGLVQGFPTTGLISIVDFVAGQGDDDIQKSWGNLSVMLEMMGGFRERILAAGEAFARRNPETDSESLSGSTEFLDTVAELSSRFSRDVQIFVQNSGWNTYGNISPETITDSINEILLTEMRDAINNAVNFGTYRVIKASRVISIDSSGPFEHMPKWRVEGVTRFTDKNRSGSLSGERSVAYEGHSVAPLLITLPDGSTIRFNNPAKCPAFSYGYQASSN